MGGGALLPGFDQLLHRETGLPIHVDGEPLTTVVRGAGRGLEELRGWPSAARRGQLLGIEPSAGAAAATCAASAFLPPGSGEEIVTVTEVSATWPLHVHSWSVWLTVPVISGGTGGAALTVPFESAPAAPMSTSDATGTSRGQDTARDATKARCS